MCGSPSRSAYTSERDCGCREQRPAKAEREVAQRVCVGGGEFGGIADERDVLEEFP